MKAFEVGKTYATRFICDHDALCRITIEARTAKTIKAQTLHGIKTLRIGYSQWEDAELVSPLGRYSMAPMVSAAEQVTA